MNIPLNSTILRSNQNLKLDINAKSQLAQVHCVDWFPWQGRNGLRIRPIYRLLFHVYKLHNHSNFSYTNIWKLTAFSIKFVESNDIQLPEYTAPSSLPITKLLTLPWGNARQVAATALFCLCCRSRISWGWANISNDQEHNFPSVEILITLCEFWAPTTFKQYTGCWKDKNIFYA